MTGSADRVQTFKGTRAWRCDLGARVRALSEVLVSGSGLRRLESVRISLWILTSLRPLGSRLMVGFCSGLCAVIDYRLWNLCEYSVLQYHLVWVETMRDHKLKMSIVLCLLDREITEDPNGSQRSCATTIPESRHSRHESVAFGGHTALRRIVGNETAQQ